MSVRVLEKTRHKTASLAFWSIILLRYDAIWIIEFPVPSNTGSGGSLNLVGIFVSNISLTKGNDASITRSSSFLGLILTFCIASLIFQVRWVSCKVGMLVLDDSPSLSFYTFRRPLDLSDLLVLDLLGAAEVSWFLMFSSWFSASSCCCINSICFWMFFLMVSLLDGVKLGVWGTEFTFGVCSSGNGSMKGRGMLCIGSV